MTPWAAWPGRSSSFTASTEKAWAPSSFRTASWDQEVPSPFMGIFSLPRVRITDRAGWAVVARIVNTSPGYPLSGSAEAVETSTVGNRPAARSTNCPPRAEGSDWPFTRPRIHPRSAGAPRAPMPWGANRRFSTSTVSRVFFSRAWVSLRAKGPMLPASAGSSWGLPEAMTSRLALPAFWSTCSEYRRSITERGLGRLSRSAGENGESVRMTRFFTLNLGEPKYSFTRSECLSQFNVVWLLASWGIQ